MTDQHGADDWHDLVRSMSDERLRRLYAAHLRGDEYSLSGDGLDILECELQRRSGNATRWTDH
jgi:hypothetical protein